jgi:hypothetical protein
MCAKSLVAPEVTRMTEASAAHLKFLHHKRQIQSRNFKWKSGTRKYKVASAHDFPKFVKR